MMMKIARWCSIYGICASAAMLVLSLINSMTIDTMALLLFGVSIGAYYYLDKIVIPQLDKYNDGNNSPAKDDEPKNPSRKARSSIKKKK